MCSRLFKNLRVLFIHSFAGIGKIPPCMRIAVGICEPRNFVLYQMILLESIRYEDAMIILIELFRMIMMSGLLIFIQDDLLILKEFA